MPVTKLDIETIPDQSDGALQRARDLVKVPANYKKPDVIDKYITDHTDEAWRKTALSGLYGEIVVVCYALNDGPVRTVARSPEEPEADLLRSLWDLMQKELQNGGRPIWCGWNVGFDLKFLWHRSVKHQVRPPFDLHHDEKPWSNKIIDLMHMWDSKNYTKLKVVCDVLGILPDDHDIDGSEVWDYIKAGDLQSVVEHCEADVRRLQLLHKRLNFL